QDIAAKDEAFALLQLEPSVAVCVDPCPGLDVAHERPFINVLLEIAEVEPIDHPRPDSPELLRERLHPVVALPHPHQLLLSPTPGSRVSCPVAARKGVE